MRAAREHSHDPLLECLAVFAKVFHRPISIEGLVAGLPVKPGEIDPELFSIESPKGLFSRVAYRAGFSSRLVKRGLDDLSDLLLPCILLLGDHRACILAKIDREQGRAKVILPEVGDAEEWIGLDRLREDYIGFAFLLKKEYQDKHRSLTVIDPQQGHWFWGTLARAKGIYASVLLASVMINIFVLATPLFTMNVYDRVVPNNAVETLWVLAIGVVTIYVFDATLRYMRNYLIEIAGKKADVIMSSVLFEQVMNLRIENWPKSVGAFASKLNQFESIRNFITSSTLVTLVDIPFALLSLAVIAYIGDPLVAVPLITMALLLLYGLVLVRPLRASVEGVFAASAHKNSMLFESLHAIETIKTMGAARYAQWAWEESTAEIAERSLRVRVLSGSLGVATNILVQFNMVGIVILGVYQIMDQKLTLGGLIAVAILASRAIAPMAQVATLVTTFQQTKAAFRSLDEMMRQPVERPSDKSFVRRPNFEGAIELKDVEFAYPEAPKPTLTGISLKIAPRERIAIIGRVGCGKTSLVKLLVGIYAPTSGTILVDDLDITQIDPVDLRRNIGYLSQEVELIRGTLRENILLKDPQADDEALLAAANVAGVDLFVNSMSQGYDTPLGEHGSGLSGGQRQCLALARTVLLEEPIVILDEPTNSMDNSTESTVRQRLHEYTRDKTLLLVTHKATLLSLVDRLVVMEEGRIILDGPKDEVLKALQERNKPV